jgi:hypothetical protein
MWWKLTITTFGRLESQPFNIAIKDLGIYEDRAMMLGKDKRTWMWAREKLQG